MADAKGQAVRGDGVQTHPEAVTSVVPDAPEVLPDPNAAARQDVQDEPLAPAASPGDKDKPSAKPAEKEKPAVDEMQKTIDDLPEGNMKEACRNMYQDLKENPGSNGPLSAGILKLMIMAARSGVMLDSIPYSYHRRLDKMTDKVFDESQVKDVLATSRDEEREKVTDAQKTEFGKNQDRASVKYACNAMWGKDFGIESTDELAAKLLHTKNKEGGKPLYRPAQKPELKKMGMPYGTVLVFKPTFKEPLRFVAFATGHEDEFKWYDVNNNTVQTSHLKDFPLNCIQAFVPQFNSDIDYFGTPAAEGKKKFTIEEEVDDTVAGKALALKKKIETEAKVAKEFEERLKTDPEAKEFNKTYLFDKVREFEDLFKVVMSSLKQIKSKEALTSLLLVVDQEMEIIEIALRYLEAAKTAGLNPTEKADIEEKMEYLRSDATSKALQYRDDLQNALESLGQK